MKKLLLLLSLLPLAVIAQTTVKPDCTIPFSFTTTGSTSNLTCGNNTLGIANWIVAYTSTGFSGISLVVQSAPDSGGTPGSWGTFAGTVLSSTQYPGSSGINPNTATTSANTGLAGYFPWMRVNLASITGTGKVTGSLYGFLNSTLAKAATSSGGAVVTIAGTTNQIVVSGTCNGTTGTCTIGLANNTILPGNPSTPGTFTAAGLISSEAASGNLQLNGLTSGNVTLSVADIAGTAIVYMWPTTNGTAGQVLSDSGVATCPTLPAGAPTVCHQLAWIAAGGSGTAGGGVLGYSASALSLPTAGTTFLAPVGGALASTTEANVTANAPAAAAISNMYVTLSAAPGTGNTIAFTFRDAGSSTALTCTISGASATSCQDVTHSFTPVVGDALAVQVVTTGTVVIAPVIKIIAEYGVTGGGGGGTPGGSFSEYQYRAGASTFGGIINTGPVILTGWTWFNQGTANVDDFSADQVSISLPNNSALNLRGWCQPLAAKPYSAIITLETNATVSSGSVEAAIFLTDGTKAYDIDLLYQPGTSTIGQIRTVQWTTSTNATAVPAGPTVIGMRRATLKISDDATNLKLSYWLGGAFTVLDTQATGTFLTPTNICIGGVTNDGTTTGNPVQNVNVSYFCNSATATCNGQ